MREHEGCRTRLGMRYVLVGGGALMSTQPTLWECLISPSHGQSFTSFAPGEDDHVAPRPGPLSGDRLHPTTDL